MTSVSLAMMPQAPPLWGAMKEAFAGFCYLGKSRTCRRTRFGLLVDLLATLDINTK